MALTIAEEPEICFGRYEIFGEADGIGLIFFSVSEIL